MGAICHKSWGSWPEASSPLQSSFFSLPASGLSRGFEQSPLTRCQTFWGNLYSQTALQNPHWCLMSNRNQRACKVQPLSAELILWITGHGTKKWGICAHLDSPTARKWGGQNPHRIADTEGREDKSRRERRLCLVLYWALVTPLLVTHLRKLVKIYNFIHDKVAKTVKRYNSGK